MLDEVVLSIITVPDMGKKVPIKNIQINIPIIFFFIFSTPQNIKLAEL